MAAKAGGNSLPAHVMTARNKPTGGNMRTILFATTLMLPLAMMPARADTLHFHADMKGASEVPPTDSAGTGTLDLTVDTAAKSAEYTLTWTGLADPATAAHIHGPAPAGKNAGVEVNFGKDPVSPVHGTAAMTDEQITQLKNGLFYVNVHTAAHPKGAIRGQIEAAK
jgi:hypothetical protein